MSNTSPIEVLSQASPEAAEAFGALRQAVVKGALDATTEELVVVAALAARGQLGSLAVHTRRALHHGVSADQLRQAVVVTLAAATLFGEAVAALRTIDDVVTEVGAGASAASEQRTGEISRNVPSGAPVDAWLRPAAPSRLVDGPLSATLYAPDQPAAVVLLHSLALDWRVWAAVVDPLATRLAVLACDLPGHGRSPRAPEPTVESMADRVSESIAASGIKSAAVVGMSLGGSVAQALAVRHPDQVRALALLDTTAYYGPEAPAAWAQRADQARQKGLLSLAQFQLERWFSDAFRRHRPDICDAVLDLFSQTDLDGYTDACTALGAMDLRQDVEAIGCPTVVVVGEHDQATPLAHAEDIGHRVRGSKVHVVRDCKHLTAVERPAAVLGLVADVLGA